MIAPSALLQERTCLILAPSAPRKSRITATVILFSKITVWLDFQNYRTVIIFTVEKGMAGGGLTAVRASADGNLNAGE